MSEDGAGAYDHAERIFLWLTAMGYLDITTEPPLFDELAAVTGRLAALIDDLAATDTDDVQAVADRTAAELIRKLPSDDHVTVRRATAILGLAVKEFVFPQLDESSDESDRAGLCQAVRLVSVALHQHADRSLMTTVNDDGEPS